MMESEESIVRLEGVHKAFGDLVVLDGVSMDFPRGKTTSIVGPSGTGKSVLIKHIVGLLRPDAGKVWVGEIDVAQANPRQLREVRSRFGMLFQHGALFDNLSAGENVEFPLRYHKKMSAAQRRARAEEVLDLVELDGLYDRPTAALSGGQRKRVGLARAIVMEPEVVLFDEPNSGLDPLTSSAIDQLIVRMKRRLGMTFIVITHDIVQAVEISDYIGMLYGGHLIEYASTEEFLRTPHQVVRDFFARNIDMKPPKAPMLSP